MNQKILSSVLVLFTLSSCQFFGSKETEFVAVDSEVSQMSAFDQSLQLDTDYISNFRLDGFTDPGEDTKYLIEKQKLIDAYNA
jgi:hypothetical protein